MKLDLWYLTILDVAMIGSIILELSAESISLVTEIAEVSRKSDVDNDNQMSIRDVCFPLCAFQSNSKMSDFLHILLHVIGLLHFAHCAKTTERFYDITDPAFIDECVKEHNRHRANVNPPASNMRYMTWDEGLARSAQAWARNCVLQVNPASLNQPGRMHPIFTDVGENLLARAPYINNFKVQSAIKSWMKQDQHYNYDSNECSKVCRHYLQVVWADTYKVGCAAHRNL
ncbi:glioma pathogenesis-related protein 1-like isoform X2 [Misgurnus anguillicaudatus]|uniref:glioma pathogenesis-related protein 1-like isoform X2 n=1 Tax=Misgurnus anguillicaudatus TaxID=75329 RepID=UPI003CCF9F4B